MNDRIKDYFAFNKKEQRGMIILLGLLLFAIAFNLFMPDFISEEEFDIGPFQQQVDSFLTSVKKHDSIRAAHKSYAAKASDDNHQNLNTFRAAPFYFDPNELKEEQWAAMGMSPFIIKNILRYREKGGMFRNREDLKKIYGMNDEIFSIMKNYILIKEKSTPSQKKYGTEVQNNKPAYTKKFDAHIKAPEPIELNSADSSAILTFHGIGPSYSSRIINYRDRLGGFTTAEQLLEIKGMDSIRLAGFRDQFYIDPENIKKIDLNNATFKELLRHPYFEYYLVKAIFNFKDEIGSFDSVGQLKTLDVMYEELYKMTAPYLEVLQKSE